MTPDELRALTSVRFNWTLKPDDVWKTSPEDVPELHSRVIDRVRAGIRDADLSTDASPLGLIIQGQRGVGKTHLLGWVRGSVQSRDGYFFLIAFSHGDAFWPSVVESILDGLSRQVGSEGRQVDRLLKRLGALARAERTIESALTSSVVSKPRLDSFISRLDDIDGHLGDLDIQDTARALVLYASKNPEAQVIAKDYFRSAGDVTPAVRGEWGMRSIRPPRLIVRDLSRLMALAGPTVMAIDQIDTLVARYATSWETIDSSREDAGRDELISQIADGLMGLEEITRRTLLVVACLPNSWQLIQTRGVDSVQDRFREASQLARIPTAEVGRKLVERRFEIRYRESGFVPPYPTWPVALEAFSEAVNYTPRSLLQRIEAHVQQCLDAGEVVELRRFGDPPFKSSQTGRPVAIEESDLARLDARFAELKSQAEGLAVFNPAMEDKVVPPLLAAGLTAWIQERRDFDSGYDLDPPPSLDPALHARLRKTLNEDVDAESHWAFRAISHPNATAVLKRLDSAITVSGIERGDRTRLLFLLRNDSWSKGPKTTQVIDAFHDAGGVDRPMTDDDLRTFSALKKMFDENDPMLWLWLTARRPASKTELLGETLPAVNPEAVVGSETTEILLPDEDSPPTRPIPIVAVPTQAPAAPAANASESSPTAGNPIVSAVPSIQIGRVMGSEQPVMLGLESLRKHVAIFAGSGSGKTVLIRRLVEEAALQGVSSIVLDPNNDLARLGDEWPTPPANWAPDDPARARRYLADTDIVIWTPRREAGRPVSFQPLPDFASVAGDADEFRMAVDVAFGALAPRAKADGRNRKAQEEQAVLRESIRFFAQGGGGSLEDLIDVMRNLPPEATTIDAGVKMAAAMAQTLTAAMINDPLFGGGGQALDPAVLLTPAAGKRARVSVINFIGLPSDSQRQGFVSQLQMALFSWFKKHPSDRPLGALLVMDEAQTLAPSGAMTVSTESTLVLASQARKYGLGLVFATQAPKGLHNRIPGNAATQLYGFLNSPSQIQSAREIARAKGGDVPDIGQLSAGEFYVAAEGTSFAKMHTRFCLSYHGSPLNADEVIARARRSADGEGGAGTG